MDLLTLHPSQSPLNMGNEVYGDELKISDELLNLSKIQAIGDIDYLSMTVVELKAVAENKGIEIPSTIKKDDLIKLLQESEV